MNESKLRVENIDLAQAVQIAKGFADQAVAREAGRARREGFWTGSAVVLLLAGAVVGFCAAAGVLRVGLPSAGGSTVAPPVVDSGPVGVPAGGTPAPLLPAPGLPPADRK